MTRKICIFLLSFLLSVLLSAHVKRYGVPRMRVFIFSFCFSKVLGHMTSEILGAFVSHRELSFVRQEKLAHYSYTDKLKRNLEISLFIYLHFVEKGW